MSKRIFVLLLAICVMASLAGCTAAGSQNEKEPAKTSQTPRPGESAGNADNGVNFNEAPYTINLSYPVYSTTQPDLQKVFDKVNEIALKKINAKVELKVVSIAAMANTYALAASSGEKTDLIMLVPGNNYLVKYVQSNMIRPIDDEMEKYGKDIVAAEGNMLDAARYEGKLYGIPAKEPSVNATGVWLLKSIVDKYNIDVSKIKTYADLGPIFEQVHAGEPDLQIFFPSSSSYYFNNYDNLGNNYGVLRNGGQDDLKLVNMYEDQAWIDGVKKMREWYLKGYIPKDFATTQDQPSAMMNSGKVFCIQNSLGYDKRVMFEQVPKVPVVLNNPIKKTTTFQTFIWAVPFYCERPDKAIQFLNLVFQDVELNMLLKYGIEGEHYEKAGDGVIDITKGFKTYQQNWQIWGDIEKLPVPSSYLQGEITDIKKLKASIEAWNATIKTSKGYGFIFNTEPVKTEIAALDAISEQYAKIIEGGGVDPDKMIPKFNEQLKAAGLQKVIDEKQRQLDEWAKSQNK